MPVCYPYGIGVSCVCDGRGRIYRCDFPNVGLMKGGAGGANGGGNIDVDAQHLLNDEAILSRDDRAGEFGNGGSGLEGDLLGDLTSSPHGRRGLDERTEIILAATFLVLIVLAFISFVIYRCEKNYMRRRLQESFHMSTAGGPGGILSNGGFMASLTGGASTQSQIPSISVSVQTEPTMLGSSTIANGGHTLLPNGVTGPQVNGANGNANNGNRNSHAIMALHHHSATLPHHSAITKQGLSTFNQQSGVSNALVGANTGNHNRSGIAHHSGIYMHSNNDILDVVDAQSSAGVLGSRDNPSTADSTRNAIHQQWNRDSFLGRSYRDVREVAAANTLPSYHALTSIPSSNSRDNTLSREIHHFTDRELGIRASCTTENLVRSPSVAGTNGGHMNDDLDEANTDYAESDVMLGGANTSNSNGSNDRTNGNSGHDRDGGTTNGSGDSKQSASTRDRGDSIIGVY